MVTLNEIKKKLSDIEGYDVKLKAELNINDPDADKAKYNRERYVLMATQLP